MRIVLAVSIGIGLNAVEVHIAADKGNIEISSEEATQFRFDVKQRGIVIDEKEAKRVLQERRLLADAYLENNDISEEDRRRIEQFADRLLAERYMRQVQAHDELDDDILYSYYKSHPEAFRAGDSIEYDVYEFDRFDDAYRFYAAMREGDQDKAQQLAKAAGAEKKHDEKLDRYLLPSVRSQLPERFEKPIVVTPIKVKNKSYVFRIDAIHYNQPLPYNDKLKERIRQTLYAKTYKRMRRKAVEDIRKERAR